MRAPCQMQLRADLLPVLCKDSPLLSDYTNSAVSLKVSHFENNTIKNGYSIRRDKQGFLINISELGTRSFFQVRSPLSAQFSSMDRYSSIAYFAKLYRSFC